MAILTSGISDIANKRHIVGNMSSDVYCALWSLNPLVQWTVCDLNSIHSAIDAYLDSKDSCKNDCFHTFKEGEFVKWKVNIAGLLSCQGFDLKRDTPSMAYGYGQVDGNSLVFEYNIENEALRDIYEIVNNMFRTMPSSDGSSNLNLEYESNVETPESSSISGE